MDALDDTHKHTPNPLDPLWDSNEAYRLLVDTVVDSAIYMLDPNGQIVSWNTGAHHIMGYAAAEVIGRHVSLFFTPQDIQAGKPARILDAAVRTGRYDKEMWGVRKDGTLLWISMVVTPLVKSSGELGGFGCIVRDITEWRHAEEAFRQSEERFRLLVEGVHDYAIFLLDTTGRVVTWNSGAERIKGYAPDEIIGLHFSLFYPPEDVLNGKPQRALRIATAEGRYEEIGWRLRKDGSRFWANVLITSLFDDQHQLRGFAKVTRDMTERKRAEAQREQLRDTELQLLSERDARAQMEAAVRMRDTFLAILAHELRTPLTSLLGNAQLLLRRAAREGAHSERDRHHLQVIVDQATRLTELISLQLELSRLQTGQLRLEQAAVDLIDVARRVVEEIQPVTTKHTISYTAPEASLVVKGDELRLIQVLQNLVQNAIKYSPGGGLVHVQVEHDLAAVRVAVSDEGIGIPQADVPLLFERFYRASNVDEQHISGLGVGLYVVKELVTLHGGTVEVVSNEGRGSTFTVTLPLA